MDYPKLRYVETFPVEISGEKLVGLRDPLNLADKVLFLPPPALFVVSMFDGKHSLRDIQAAFMQRFGELIFLDKIQGIVTQLDSHLFLDSNRFRDFESQARREFLDAPTRVAAHAGVSYPKKEDELKSFLAAHFAQAAKEGSQNETLQGQPPCAIIAPHIDLRQGGVCYGWAYEQIRRWDYDLFVILGTSHAPTRNRFAATAKDFETPIGLVKTDRYLLEQLNIRCGTDLFEDEFAHKLEHSVEFQVLYLKYLYSDRQQFTILPILCGSFHDMLTESESGRPEESFQEFVNALRDLLDHSRKKVCIIAGADLSHIGLRFGDPRTPDAPELRDLEQEDRTKIEAISRRDREGFWESIRKDGDRRRVCGFPCIYTLLNLLPACSGKLLRYDQMDDRNTGSAVSFASLVFH